MPGKDSPPYSSHHSPGRLQLLVSLRERSAGRQWGAGRLPRAGSETPSQLQGGSGWDTRPSHFPFTDSPQGDHKLHDLAQLFPSPWDPGIPDIFPHAAPQSSDPLTHSSFTSFTKASAQIQPPHGYFHFSSGPRHSIVLRS